MRPHPRVVPHRRVVIVGAGFGGLQCAKALRDQPVDVLLVDRQNYHLFTPLLYQVASCLLNPSEIAAPLRKVLRGAPNVRYRQGEVVDADFARQRVTLAEGEVLDYDELVLATGSVTNYYGNDVGRVARARVEGSRSGAAAPQPRARLPRTSDRDDGCRRAPATVDVLHRRRRTDRGGVRGRARRAGAAGAAARVPGAPRPRAADRAARRRRPRVADVQAPPLLVRAARARASRSRRSHRRARRVRRRVGRGDARRNRAADRDHRVDRGSATRRRSRCTRP